MAIRPLTERELVLLATPDDTEDAPWMVMSSLQSRDVFLLLAILLFHAQEQHLPWCVEAFLKLTLRRPDGRLLEVAPDLLVGLGSDRLRTSWQIDAEEKAPEFVLEVASSASWRRDSREKPHVYEAAGVQEYALFWPDRADGGPKLFGYRRGGQAQFTAWAPDTNGVLWSDVLELGLYVEEGLWLRAMDEERRRLPTPTEARAAEAAARQTEAVARQAEAVARTEAERRAEQEARARQFAEAEVARLREELRRLREGGA